MRKISTATFDIKINTITAFIATKNNFRTETGHRLKHWRLIVQIVLCFPHFGS